VSTGNSHGNPAPNKNSASKDAIDKTEKTEEEPVKPPEEKKKSHFSRKEKSVLQTKLTRLAIQIGYAGRHFLFCWLRCVFAHCSLGGSGSVITSGGELPALISPAVLFCEHLSQHEVPTISLNAVMIY